MLAQSLDARQAAGYLAMSVEKLRRLAHSGVIEHSTRSGNRLLFTTVALDSYLERARVQPGELSHLVDKRHPR